MNNVPRDQFDALVDVRGDPRASPREITSPTPGRPTDFSMWGTVAVLTVVNAIMWGITDLVRNYRRRKVQ